MASLSQGRNVLVQGSLRDGDWNERYIKRLKEQFPHLRVAIIHVSAKGLIDLTRRSL